jgi:hypothetical protein
MKVSIDNITGAFIEMQSNGNDAVMIANAESQGFSDVTVQEVSEQQFKDLLAQSALINETPEQVIARLEKCLDEHLDSVAKSYRYESIRTMVTYVNDPDPEFQSHGVAALAFRSAVYRYGINKIKACTREVSPETVPTEAELISGLPLFSSFL